MGDVVSGECVTNALPTNNHSGALSSLDFQRAWEALQEVLMAEHAMEAGAPVAELLREEKEEDEEDWRRGSYSTGSLAP